MTTEESGSSPILDKQESLTCAQCPDILTTPKLLACGHTFCQKCLDNLTQQHPQGSLPCPACHTDIHVAEEGAAGFDSLDIDQEELEKTRDDSTCSAHAQEKVVVLCVECEVLICMNCKLAAHLHHKSQSLREAKKEAQHQLSKDKVRLRQMKADIKKKIQEPSKDLEEFRIKKAAVESKIRYRHALVVAEADKYINEALKSVQEACFETENKMIKKLQTAKDIVRKLKRLEQRTDLALQNEDGCKIVNTAIDVRTGSGSEDSVRRLEVRPLQHVSRPVHLADTPEDVAMFHSIRNFIGRAQQVMYHYADPDVTVKQEARCGHHADSVVFCVCPVGRSVYVSFEADYKSNEPCVKTISTENQAISDSEEKGPASYKCRAGDRFIMFRNFNQQFQRVFVKYKAQDFNYLLDTRKGNNTGTVSSVKVLSEEPFTTKRTRLFDISCGHHRAVDVHRSETLYAVVEDSVADRPGHKRRRVRLFRNRQRDATDTYLSPLSPWRPADVCFWTLDGKEVLLIADDMNDAIHVTEVKDGRVTFRRFLAPGCPILMQPTVLNTDPQGRLWVGCRGGTLLTVQPVPAAAVTVDVDDDVHDDDDDDVDDDYDDGASADVKADASVVSDDRTK